MMSRDGQPFNMADYCIGQAARAMPSKAALLVYEVHHPDKPSEAWTFAELEDAVQRLAAALDGERIEAGDRIAIRLGNSSQSALMFFAAIAGGFVALPLSDQLTTPELGTLLEDSGAAAIATARAVARRDRSRRS